ncbi:MAG TPA: hypothetical protein VGQ94_03070 [Terriglobales bacterium]|nr:hypothetical protein [Terriglobales bacterium]
MKLRLLLLFASGLLALPAFAAGAPRCVRGAPELQKDLWDGYSVEIGPPAGESRKDLCRAAILAPGGKVLFETFDSEASVNPITGTDVNGDDKPDVVLETRGPRGKCCFNYYIISLAEPAGLLRAISVSVPLTFEDRDGDGKVEMWTRDNAFDSIEGLPTTDSPYPMVFFRLKGTTLYNVSPAFWSEYEADIAQARGQISKGALEDMLKVETGEEKPRPPDAHDPKAAEYMHIKGLVLQITLDYLYGGRGQQAWDTIRDMWRDNDKGRIRQVILQVRGRGVFREINRQPILPATPPPTSR